MAKKRKIDFILYDDNDERLIFRFYPRQSSCHSFGDEPPKSWKEVYKEYFAYSVLKQYIENDGTIFTITLFEEPCDECSVIYDVGFRCKLISEGRETYTRMYNGESYTFDLLDNEISPIGMGTSWNIKKHSDDLFKIEMFNWNEAGFRFWLNKKELKEFSKYLEECCEYMLAHGDPI